MDFKVLIEQSWTNTLKHIGPILLITLVQMVVIICSFGILAPVTTAGYINSFLRTLREDRPPEVGDLFSEMRLFLPLFGFFLLVTVAVFIGLIFLVLPGIVVICFTAFATFYMLPLMVDKNLGLFDAIKESWDNAVKPPVSEHLIVVIIYVVIMSLSSSFPLVFLITQPLATFILVGAYQERVAPPQIADQPPAQPSEVKSSSPPPPPPPQEESGENNTEEKEEK